MSRRRRLFRRRRQTSPRTKRADRRSLTKPARRLELEYLEPRILLTTLFGGETFSFRAANPSGDDASAPLAQVILSGDIIVELIGADVDDLNRPLFGDLSGEITGDSLGRDGTDIGGGIGAVDGVDPVTGDFALGAPMDVFDVDRFGNRVLFYDVPIDDGNVMFNAIATRDALAGGQTYGINTSAAQESDSRNLHLVEIEATTGQGDIRAMLQRATLAEDFMSSLRDGGGSVLLDGVRALAVDRSDLVGTAYVVNVEGGTNDSVLYSVNRQVGTTTALGTITNTTSGLPVSNINAMAFNAAGELVLLTDDLDGFGGANDPGFINLGDPKLGGFDTDFTNAETVVVTIPDPTPGGGGAPISFTNRFFTAMDFDSAGRIVAVARPVSDPSATLDQLVRIATTGETEILADIENVVVEGIAFSQGIDDPGMLVGTGESVAADPTVVNSAQLFSIEVPEVPLPQGGTVTPSMLSAPGETIDTFGLGSFEELPGQGRLLFGIDQLETGLNPPGNAVIRGSAVALPVDPETGVSQVAALEAADFRPSTGSPEDGLLYFVAMSGADQNLLSDRLYTLDVDRFNRSAIQNSMVDVRTLGLSEIAVHSIAWERHLDSAGQPTASLSTLSTVASPIGLMQNIHRLNPTFGTGFPTLGGIFEFVNDDQRFLTDMTAIEFPDDDPLIEDPFILATTDGNNPRLLRIRRFDDPLTGDGAGGVISFGSLLDFDDSQAPRRGGNIQGLSWDPLFLNPFTGTRGALLGTDITTDDLLLVDHRPRFPSADIFMIYVTQAEPNASISIARLSGAAADDPDADTDPDEEAAGRVLEPIVQTGEVITIRPDGENIQTFGVEAGGVILGTRTEAISGDDPGLVPITQGIIDSQFGTRPQSFDDRPDLSTANIAAGLRVVGSLLEFYDDGLGLSNTLRQNLDAVTELAVSADGQEIVALDLDGIGPDGGRIFDLNGDGFALGGEPTLGAQLGRINPFTGRVGEQSDVIDIVDAITGLPLRNLVGLDFGDADLDVTTGALDSGEDLYSIAVVDAPTPIDRSGEGLGGVLGDLGGTIRGLTATPGGITYAILERPATPLELVEISRDPLGGINTVTILGEIMGLNDSNAFEDIENINTLEVDENGQLRFIGNYLTDPNQRIFTLSPTVIPGGGPGPGLDLDPSDEVFAPSSIVLDFDPDPLVDNFTTDPFQVLTQHSEDGLFVIQDDGGLGTTFIVYELDPFTGVLTEVAGATNGDGQIFVAGVAAVISAGDIDQNDTFLAIDRSAPAGDGRIIAVDLFDPALSRALTGASSIAPDLNGFSNDLNNLNLAIAENGIGTDDELFVSEAGNLTLGTIDLTTEIFTAIGTIRDATGNELTGASALAFSPGEGSIPGQQGLYLLDAAEQLWEIDPAAGPNGGRLIDITGNPIADITASFQGNFLRRGAGPDNSFFTLDDQLVDIRSMDFDASGQLLAQVGLDGNLVNIDLTTRGQPLLTWGNVVNTEIGSLRPTVGSITYDTFNNRFLVVDNATGTVRIENEGPGVESSILMVMDNWDNDSVLHQNMNKFHFAGAIFGHVDVFGAMNEFYVGWLLTGQGSEPGVLPIPEFPLIQDNFLIEGDLRSLIINANQDTLAGGGEGGGDGLSSGVDMQIGGRLGQYLAIDTSASGATIEVENSDSAPFISLQEVPQHEIESRGSLIAGDPAAGDENLVDTEFRQHRLFFGDDRFSNDNPIQAQRLGTVASGIPGVPDSIQVFGETNLEGGLEDEVEEADPTTPLPTDFGDWYAVGLTAGQEITVTVDGLHDFTVFDPELRPIGFGSTGSFTGVRVPMRVRAVIPGEYFIQITDVFLLEGEDDVIEPGSGIDYLLRITDMEKRDELGALNSRANVGVGGVVTRGLADVDPDARVVSNVDITLLRGDFGSVFAPGGIDGSINVAAGDLRSFDTFGAGTGTYVVSEDIGLFRALTQISGGTTGGGEEGDEDEEELLTLTLISAGADIQVIETAGPIVTGIRIEAGGGLGSLRAGSVDFPFFDFTFDGIYVNSDGVGNDGIIDLIDVTGDWGAPVFGGMPILTGPGGNVRYMRVGGDLHQDASFFGTTTPPLGTTDIQLLPGEFVDFTDDGGGRITIANDSEDFFIDPLLILAAQLDPTIILPIPIVNVATYAMREGGVVVVKVEAGQSVDIHGDLVDPALSVEIGELEITGAVGATGTTGTTGTSDGVFGPNFITDEFGNVTVGAGFDLNGNVIPELDPQELSVDITGDGEVSIFHVEAPGINFSRIINHTGGDIPNLNIGSIVRLQTQGSIGFADARATLAPIGGAFGSLSLPFGSALVPDGSTDPSDEAPFPHFLPRLYIQTEHVIRMLAGEAIGNIEVVGHLVFAQANTDLSRNPDLFEGIAAPLHVNGNLGTLNVGEGVLPSGAGARRAGIYVGGGVLVGDDGGATVPGGVDVLTGNIDLIYNQGLLNPSAPPEVTGIADIRGDVHATSNINEIRLHNGSLINNFVAAAESTLGNPFLFEGRFDVLPDLDENILDIVLTGSASGIIGSYIIAPTVGDVTVLEGFGIFETEVQSVGVSGIGDFIADSYGFSRVEFSGGTQMGNLTALGTGLPQNVSDFSPSVRMVEQFAFDPFFDAPPSTSTDLYFHLPGIAIDDRGTPAFEDAFLNGRISEVSYQGARSMGLVTGHRIEELEISVGDSFTGIITRGTPVPFSISDSFLITGALGRFTPHAGITGTELSVAGPIRNIDIFGHVIDTAIRTDGPSGDIQNMRVRGNMDGILEVHGTVRRLQIDENLSGTVLIDGVAPNHTALQTFTLGGSMLDGSFRVIGNVTTMNINGSLGSQTPFDGLEDQMLIQGNLRTFNMGRGDVTAGGDVMALNMSVIGDLSRMLIDGLVTGDLTVTGKLTSYQITADAPQVGTALMSGSINVGDDLTTFMVRNGDVGDGIGSDVNITTGGTLRTFTVTGGSVNSDVTITSALENITTVRVTGGDMLGNLAAPNGAVQTVLVSGSDIGGNIDALYIRTLRADGDILTGANINIRDGVTSFVLGGDIQAGANVNIGAARSVNLRGALLGDLSLGPSGTSTTVTIGTDLGGNLAVDGDARVRVNRTMLPGATVWIGGNGDLTVRQDLTGVVDIVGSSRMIGAATMTDAVVTTGLDLRSMRITAATANSIVQVGTRSGNDRLYGTDDLDEGNARATFLTFTGGPVSDSIFAASGAFRTYSARGMTNTTVSSGFVIGQSALAAIVADATPLADATEQNAARGAADRTLYHGDFTSARVIGNMDASAFSAGTDPGANGIIEGQGADDSVTTSLTGGRSQMRSVMATSVTGASGAVADNGVLRSRIVPLLGTNPGRIDYAVTDLIDVGAVGTPLEPFVATASNGADVTVNGLTFAINVAGAEIDVYDDPATVDRVDTIVIREDANPATRYTGRAAVKVTDASGGTVGVGRVLTADDFAFRNFSMTDDLVSTSFVVRDADVAGMLLGDGAATADPDVWFDSSVGDFVVGQYGPTGNTTAFTGHFGGGVSKFTFGTLGSTTTHVGGGARTLTVLPATTPDAGALLSDNPAVAPANLDVFDFDSTGANFVFDDVNRQLTQIGGLTVDVTDVLAGLIDLNGIAFDAADSLFGIADIFNHNPTDEVGPLFDAPRALVGLTAVPNGNSDDLFAVETSAFLPTGSFTADFDTFVDIAAAPDGDVFGIVDVGGAGTTFELRQLQLDNTLAPDTSTNPDATELIGQIEFNGVDVTDISAAAFDPTTGQLYVVGNVAAPPAPLDTLVSIYNLAGQLVVQSSNLGDEILSHALAAGGTYFVAISDEGADPGTPFATPASGGNEGDYFVYIGLNAGSTASLLQHAEPPLLLQPEELLPTIVATDTNLVTGNAIYAAETIGDHGDPLIADVDIYQINGTQTGDVIDVRTITQGLDQQLFVVDLASGAATPTDGLINLTNLSTVTQDIKDLAFQSDGTLYSVRDTGPDSLFQIDLTNGVGQDLGDIEVYDAVTMGTTNVDSAGAAFDSADQLIILDQLNPGEARRVQVDIAGPGTSAQLTIKGSESDTAVGLAYLPNSNRSLSIETNGLGTDDQLITSSATYDHLVRIDSDTGTIHTVGRLADTDANFYSSNVTAIAADPLTGFMYVLLSDADGVGRGKDSTNGAGLAFIESADFDGDGFIDLSHPFSDGLRPSLIDSDPNTAGTQIITDPLHSFSFDTDGNARAFQRVGTQDILLGIDFDESSPFVPSSSFVYAVPRFGSTGLVQLDTDLDGVGDADTNIVGSGFDANGNFIALNIDGVNDGLIFFNPITPTQLVHTEGDNSFVASNITGLTPGNAVTYDANIGDHGLLTEVDVDIFLLTPAIGEVIQIDVTALSSSLDPTVAIYDIAGARQAFDLNSGVGDDPRLTLTAASGLPHFIVVSGIDDVPDDPFVAPPLPPVFPAAPDTEGDYRIRIALDEPNPVFTPVTVPNIVDPTLDAFAITTGAANFPTYAYDSDDRINGLLFTNPGVIPTLGTVDASPISPTFGQFSQLLGLTQDAMGTPLSSDAVAVTVDPGTGDVFIATADDRLLQFDAVDGTFVHDYGPVTNDQGDRLDLNTLVVNPDPPIKPGTVEFISMDRRFGQIIEIVIDPPAPFPVDATGDTTEIEVVRARTEPGTVETQVLNDLAFDPATGTWHAIREGAPDQLVIFRDPDANSEIDENDPAFVHFDSITTANFTGAFAGRIETGGNTIRTVRVQADPLSPGDMFTGQLISNTGITSFTQSGIDFDGTLRARTGIRSVTLNGADVGTEGVFAAGRSVTTFRGSGAFAGLFDAHGVQSFSNAGLVTADAILNVDNQARTLTFGAGFEGQATIGAASSLRMAGPLDNGGLLQFDGNATTVTLSGGVGPDGSLHVLGSGRSLSIGTGHEGSIAYRGDLTTANISSLTRALLSVGGSARTVSVAGITIDSLLSFGTWIGPDGIYNTADDLILGGSAGTVTFRNDYVDSATVAGVLPRMDVATLANTPNLPADMRAFTGNAGAADLLDVDAADAGGIRSSHIGRVTMSRNVLNSESVFGGTAGRQAIVAAADGHINLFGNEIDRVHTREYVDRFGPPQVIGGVSASTNTVQVMLNEEINTSSLTASQDGNGDGDLDDLVDFQGSVTVTDPNTGRILNDVSLLYSRDIDTTGFPVPFHQGVLTIVDTSGSGFGGGVVNVTLSGAFGGDAVTDRTGTRSALRDFDQDGIQEFQEDPFGSTLDGNADGLEDGDRSLTFLLNDAPDFFEDALATTQVVLPDDQLVSLISTFDAGTFFNPDIDIFRIDNDTPGQFFGMQYIGSSDAQIAVFRLDDQGTTTSADNDLLDDTFEIVSSHERTAYSSAFEQNAAFQAVELTEVGTYFALVAAESSFFSDLSPTGDYTLNLALATTDQALVDAFGSFWVDKDDEVIGYASDFVSQHHDAGDLLVDLETYVGLAATPADDLFAVVDDTGGSGAFQLHQINVDTNLSVTAFPDLIGDIEIGGADITGISDLAVDPFTGDLYVAGIDPAAPAEQRLFTVDPTSGAATVVGRLWDVAGAAVLGDTLDGLAFRGDGMLYGIRDTGAAESVVQIDLTPIDLDASPGAPEELAVTDLGAVQIIDPFTAAPEDSDTNSAAFNLSGDLVILDSSQGFGQARRAVVDLVTPGASTVLTPAGSETDTTTTLAYRFGTDQSITIDTHGAGTNDQLLISRNLLGANVPKQLVYLNFDGGTSTKIDFLGPTVLRPLDAGVLDPGLAPLTDTLINGSANVTGIVQNIVDIFVNIPASTINPETGAVVAANLLNARQIGAAELTALAGDINRLDDGLAFTTVDPATFGLDLDIDFTTMFVGDTDSPAASGLFGIASTVDHMNASKGDEAVIFAETFSRLTLTVDVDTRLNEYSRALANVIAHEFGHTLGLNHTGTLSFFFTDPDTGEVFVFGDFNDLYPTTDHPFPDDPDNNPATPDDSNTGSSLIGSGPTIRPGDIVGSLWELGTANLTTDEFPVGDNDQVDQLLRFLT